MIQEQKYIKYNFSEELKFLISLTQEKVSVDYINGLIPNINWNRFLDLALKHRLISMTFKSLSNEDIIIPKKILNRLNELRIEQSKVSLMYSGYCLNIAKLFKEESIPYVFFKGPLLSLEIYNDVGFRNFRDIDILVDLPDVEKAKKIIEGLRFVCLSPNIKMSKKQKHVNYKISHHYYLKHKENPVCVELHWNISNPKSFFPIKTREIISNCRVLKTANQSLHYISEVYNLVYLASHGSLHQWYRLFWLKDFSELLRVTDDDKIKEAFALSKKVKLDKCFLQACYLSRLLYNIAIPFKLKLKKNLIVTPLKSMHTKDLNLQGLRGKLKFVLYRLRIKVDFRYYFDLIYRLRTHYTDWEVIRIPDSFFFLYYILRPFLLIFRFFFKK